MVGQATDFLLLDFMADLRAAKHDADIRPQSFEKAYYLRALHHIPDIDTQANYLRLQRQQLLDDACGGLANDKLA